MEVASFLHQKDFEIFVKEQINGFKQLQTQSSQKTCFKRGLTVEVASTLHPKEKVEIAIISSIGQKMWDIHITKVDLNLKHVIRQNPKGNHPNFKTKKNQHFDLFIQT